MRTHGKLVGTILALMLAVTMTAGPVYAETARTTVTLAATGTCTIESATANGGASASFGTLTWDGVAQKYIAPGGSLPSIALSSTISSTFPGKSGRCGIDVLASGELFTAFAPGALTISGPAGTNIALAPAVATHFVPKSSQVDRDKSTQFTGNLNLDASKALSTAGEGQYSATLEFTVTIGP